MENGDIVFIVVAAIAAIVYGLALAFRFGYHAGARQTDRKWIRLTQERIDKPEVVTHESGD